MNNEEIQNLKTLLRKFLRNYVNISSGIDKIEYNVDNQRFFVDYGSFGTLNTFYTVDEFIDAIIKVHNAQFE